MTELKKKPLFNPEGDLDVRLRRMIGGNTTNLNDFNLSLIHILPSAKAAVGIRHSSIHRASMVLNMRFFILLPPFHRLLTA